MIAPPPPRPNDLSKRSAALARAQFSSHIILYSGRDRSRPDLVAQYCCRVFFFIFIFSHSLNFLIFFFSLPPFFLLIFSFFFFLRVLGGDFCAFYCRAKGVDIVSERVVFQEWCCSRAPCTSPRRVPISRFSSPSRTRSGGPWSP